ncbi:hypothetical protein [Epilithonimonas hispanica]|nr:hypothetical protein [Epilithonimonas hispanica]
MQDLDDNTNEIHIPGIMVQRIFQGENYEEEKFNYTRSALLN